MMRYIDYAKKHMDILCAKYSQMLPSELDLRGDVYSEERLPKFKRVYRNIDAPNGRTAYWDQPLIQFSALLGGKYKTLAKNITKDFLDKSKATNNMLLWGNHYYYSDLEQSIVKFVGEEQPVKCITDETGHLHELRPILPCFELLFEVDSTFTKKYIYQLLKMHLVNEETGEFNRHADNKRGYAFLESGGILANIACILYKKNGDSTLIDYAKKVVGYSYSFSNTTTGLIENCPTQDRWDKYHATTETFHWCNSILNCYEITNDKYFLDLVKKAADSYIRYGVDTTKNKIFGCINVTTGMPITSDNKETIYMPDIYSNPWQTFFPTHDYIYAMAEVLLRLYNIFKNDIYLNVEKLLLHRLNPSISLIPLQKTTVIV